MNRPEDILRELRQIESSFYRTVRSSSELHTPQTFAFWYYLHLLLRKGLPKRKFVDYLSIVQHLSFYNETHSGIEETIDDMRWKHEYRGIITEEAMLWKEVKNNKRERQLRDVRAFRASIPTYFYIYAPNIKRFIDLNNPSIDDERIVCFLIMMLRNSKESFQDVLNLLGLDFDDVRDALLLASYKHFLPYVEKKVGWLRPHPTRKDFDTLVWEALDRIESQWEADNMYDSCWSKTVMQKWQRILNRACEKGDTSAVVLPFKIPHKYIANISYGSWKRDNPGSSQESRWFKIEQYAGLVGVDSSTVWRWLDKGRIGANKEGELEPSAEVIRDERTRYRTIIQLLTSPKPNGLSLSASGARVKIMRLRKEGLSDKQILKNVIEECRKGGEK